MTTKKYKMMRERRRKSYIEMANYLEAPNFYYKMQIQFEGDGK